MRACGVSLASDRFEFFGREGDRAWVLFSQFQAIGKIREKIGDDITLGLGEEDVDSFGQLAHYYSHLLSAMHGRIGPGLFEPLGDLLPCPIPTFGFWSGWSDDTLRKASGHSVDLKSCKPGCWRLCAAVIDANVEGEGHNLVIQQQGRGFSSRNLKALCHQSAQHSLLGYQRGDTVLKTR